MISKEDARKDIEEVVEKHDAFFCCVRNVSGLVNTIIKKMKFSSADTIKRYVSKPGIRDDIPPAVMEIIHNYASNKISANEARELLSERGLFYTELVKEKVSEFEKQIHEYISARGI